MIVCKEFKSFNKGSLQGFATLHISSWNAQVSGFTLHMKDGKRWVNAPSKEYEVNGEKKYQPLIWFDSKELTNLFSEEAKKAIDLFCSQQGNREHGA